MNYDGEKFKGRKQLMREERERSDACSWIADDCEQFLGQLKTGTRTKNKRIFGGQSLSQDKDMSCEPSALLAYRGASSCGREWISSEWQVPWERI